MEAKILEVRDGGVVTFDAGELFRMVRIEDGETLCEFLGAVEAEYFLEVYNDPVQSYTRAKAVSYRELAAEPLIA